MNYKDFKFKYLGKSVDWDKVWGAQCVDLIKRYIYDNGYRQEWAWDAIDYWNKFDSTPSMSKVFKKVNEPKQGDIVVIKTAGKFGHIGIIDDFHNDHILILEQDGFNQQLNTYLKYWNKNQVLGYLRFVND